MYCFVRGPCLLMSWLLILRACLKLWRNSLAGHKMELCVLEVEAEMLKILADLTGWLML